MVTLIEVFEMMIVISFIMKQQLSQCLKRELG